MEAREFLDFVNHMYCIDIRVRAPGGEVMALRYAIDRNQISELVIGERPPNPDTLAFEDWRMRLTRRDSMAGYIGRDVAARLLEALTEKVRRDEAAPP